MKVSLSSTTKVGSQINEPERESLRYDSSAATPPTRGAVELSSPCLLSRMYLQQSQKEKKRKGYLYIYGVAITTCRRAIAFTRGFLCS